MPGRAQPMRVAVGQRSLQRLAGGVLLHGDQSRRPVALDVGAAHEVPGPLRRDHRDVDAGGRHHRAEVDREPVGEHQHVAVLQVRLDVARRRPLRALVSGSRHMTTSASATASAVSSTRQPGVLGLPRARPNRDAGRPARRSRSPSGSARARAPGCRNRARRSSVGLQHAAVGVLLVVDRRHGGPGPFRTVGLVVGLAGARALERRRSRMPRSPRESAMRPVRESSTMPYSLRSSRSASSFSGLPLASTVSVVA